MFYKYVLSFENGEEKTIDIQIDPATTTAAGNPAAEPPEWARLEFCKCKVCPLRPEEAAYCPVAANLAEVTRMFSDKSSVTPVNVRVSTPHRDYSKSTSLQAALSSIIGLYMATSGCPVMETLKPMARHHLPFATLEETTFRSVSTYLMQQYLRKQKGQQPDWELEDLRKAYKDIEQLNVAMTERIRRASEKDANYNAVIILDAFAKMVPWTIGRGIKD